MIVNHHPSLMMQKNLDLERCYYPLETRVMSRRGDPSLRSSIASLAVSARSVSLAAVIRELR